MHDVFVSHVEPDATLALEIALGLEQAGYRTWCYEHDTVPGVSYLIQTGQAVEDCTVMVLVISQQAIGSRQVTKEVVRAHESNKQFIPVLCDVTHAEFQAREPEWREALGAAASIRLMGKGAAGAIPRIIDGLERLHVRPSGPADPDRLEALRELIAEQRGTPPPVTAAAGGERAFGGAAPPRDPRATQGAPPVGGAARGRVPASPPRPPPTGSRAAGEAPPAWWRRPVTPAITALAVAAVAVLAAVLFWPGAGGDRRAGLGAGGAAKRTAARDAAQQPGGTESDTAALVVVGVMEFEAQGPGPDLGWMCQNTRDSLNTILTKVGALRVYAKEKIDFVRKKQNLQEIEAAEQLGISKMISGTISMADSAVMLEVRIVDVASGFIERSIPGRRRKEELIELQNNVALELLGALDVAVTPEQRKTLFANRTNDTLDSYKLLSESLGEFVEEGEGKHSGRGGLRSWWPAIGASAAAWAQEAGKPAGGEEAAIRALLERYRTALEAKDVDTLAAIHVAMSEAQRAALARYFDNAAGLTVKFSSFDILYEGNEALATFTRSDVFKDVRSGRETTLEVRISSMLEKQEGTWKIRGLKKPS
jgi:TolB-like protein/ketosteroid isomerase-like protein